MAEKICQVFFGHPVFPKKNILPIPCDSSFRRESRRACSLMYILVNQLNVIGTFNSKKPVRSDRVHIKNMEANNREEQYSVKRFVIDLKF